MYTFLSNLNGESVGVSYWAYNKAYVLTSVGSGRVEKSGIGVCAAVGYIRLTVIVTYIFFNVCPWFVVW